MQSVKNFLCSVCVILFYGFMVNDMEKLQFELERVAEVYIRRDDCNSKFNYLFLAYRYITASIRYHYTTRM